MLFKKNFKNNDKITFNPTTQITHGHFSSSAFLHRCIMKSGPHSSVSYPVLLYFYILLILSD